MQTAAQVTYSLKYKPKNTSVGKLITTWGKSDQSLPRQSEQENTANVVHS